MANAVREFIKSIAKVPFFKNDGRPLKSWRLFETRDDAWMAAWEVAGGDGDALSFTWTAAMDAALRAAEEAAVDAAIEAAWEIEWNAVLNAPAVSDAVLYAAVIILSENVPMKHVRHARARWRVWQKGYGLLCDVDGVLYVYKRP